MPQLQINQGPQDALLYDNTRSYFTNVGYVRTSNFQVEYRNVEPQNTATFGSTVQYVIPKAADLLGPVDLRVEIPEPTTNGMGSQATAADGSRIFTQWVDELGFAMIDRVTFSVGSNDIETITGEQMQLKNELMTSDEQRLGFEHVMRSGKIAFEDINDQSEVLPDELPGWSTDKIVNKDFTRLIGYRYYKDGSNANVTGSSGKKHLIIPLNLFFTKHVSAYFPLAAVAGCNDIRISVKFRQLKELVQFGGQTAASDQNVKPSMPTFGNLDAKLFCHYVHVTGPEATTLMNKEHVRLLKLYQHQHKIVDTISSDKIDLDLSFLHPVTTLIITIRRNNDMSSDETFTPADGTHKGRPGFDSAGKGLFFYHGDGTNPNYDGVGNGKSQTGTVKVNNIQLTLNGQERHPGLTNGLDTEYLMSRLLPMLHSNSNQSEKFIMAHSKAHSDAHAVGAELNYRLKGSKPIFVYPFSLNPEGSNPSGAVNFSKVSHAKMTLHLEPAALAGPLKRAQNASGMPGSTTEGDSGLRVDVYGLYYNWLQIKDGRALLSFA